MLFTRPVVFNAYEESGFGNGDSTHGDSITPGTSNSEGSVVSLLASTAFVTNMVRVTSWLGAVSTVDKRMVLDLGYVVSSTFYPLVENINIAKANNLRSPKVWTFPLYIPAGVDLSARVQGGTTDTTATRVWVELFGKPNSPHLYRIPHRYETVGYVNGNSGGTQLTNTTTIVASGASMPASWTDLGALARAGFCAFFSTATADASSNGQIVYYDIAVGTASNKIIIARNVVYTETGTTEISNHQTQPLVYGNFPAGINFYARASSSIATLDSGYNIMAHVGLC